ncbi:MAG: ATP-binding protein [Pseudomonadota bacterium]
MYSLSARLLVSVSVLLLLFFGATIVLLDFAFRDAGEQAQRDILDGHLMSLLASAEPGNTAELQMPIDLPEARFGTIDSGLYAEIRHRDGEAFWQSTSALGMTFPDVVIPEYGSPRFAEEVLTDGTPLLTLTMAVQWEFPDESLRPFVFRVAESLDSFNAQIAAFRQQMFTWFGAIALLMLVTISIIMRRLLKPLRQIEGEIGEIETGTRQSLSGEYPTELRGVARNMNLLIDTERARSDRYRTTLDNLAHSLKTPLAAVRALLREKTSVDFETRANEQIDHMDEIVRYQLRKPAAGKQGLGAGSVSVAEEITRLVAGLSKVYSEKNPTFDIQVDDKTRFRGDRGDFMEVAGNLLDNACKWCESQVAFRMNDAGTEIVVNDDGPGIPDDAVSEILQRGARLDENTPGHGIGLAIVREIAESYSGELSIQKSALGGAQIRVTIPSD